MFGSTTSDLFIIQRFLHKKIELNIGIYMFGNVVLTNNANISILGV